MQDTISEVATILAVCLLIAAVAVAIILFRPAARRRRRHKRHSRRPKIDLFKTETTETAAKSDA
jgi:hypothetical protein